MRKRIKKLVLYLLGLSQEEINSINQYSQYQKTVMNTVVSAEMNDIYLFDFKNWASQYNGMGTGFIGISADGSVNGTVSKIESKIKIKPIDVLNELENVPTIPSLVMLDEKISILKDKTKLIQQNYAKREVEGLIERLENRKKYNEHKDFFGKFQSTTEEKITPLLKKYELVMKTADIFIPEFPAEAVKVMKEYTEKLQSICGKKPVFYVIAEEKDFKSAYEKRDPILLAQSPFSFTYDILGAWDKEMLCLAEL